MCVKERKWLCNLLRLLSWRMMAESVLFITHSSSLPMPSGSTPRHRCLGSMFLFTSGMTAAPYTATAHSTCPDKTQTLYLNTHTCTDYCWSAKARSIYHVYSVFSCIWMKLILYKTPTCWERVDVRMKLGQLEIKKRELSYSDFG